MTLLRVFQLLLVLNGPFLLNASASALGTCSLARPVNAFVAPRQSRLASLRDFARQNRLSFGIESVSGLNEQVAIHAPAGPVLSVVIAILAPASKSSLRCSRGVILVRDSRPSRQPAWLDTTVPDFRLNRSRLGSANVALWMRVELTLNPHQQGFGGDTPGDPGEEVAPFHAVHATVRALLCRLVASSRGSLWIIGDVGPLPGTSWSNRLWTLLPYEPVS